MADQPRTLGIFDPELINKSRVTPGSNDRILRLATPAREPLWAAAADLAADILAATSWVVFGDAWAVDAFAGFSMGPQYLPDEVRVCAVGESTASRLRPLFVHSDITVQTADPIKAAAAIAEYEGGLSGAGILILHRAEDASWVDLNAFGSEASATAVYRATFQDPPAAAKMRSLILGGALDAIFFSTPDDVLSIAALLERGDMPAVLSGTELYCTSPEACSALLEHGLRGRLQR